MLCKLIHYDILLYFLVNIVEFSIKRFMRNMFRFRRIALYISIYLTFSIATSDILNKNPHYSRAKLGCSS